MATDVSIPPALTELEWRNNISFPELGDYPCEIAIELVADGVLIREWEYGDDPVKTPTLIYVPCGARQALAALALDGQPFGFSFEEALVVRWAAEFCEANWVGGGAALRTVAAKIAALAHREE